MVEVAKQSGKFVVNGIELDREETRKAKVLYDYEADNENELTVYCDQVSKPMIESTFRLIPSKCSPYSFHYA